MARYILGRLLGLIFVLFAVSLITFLLTRAVPGDPFASGERELPEATQIARAAKYGFDQPILVQYGRYVWNVLHGDFGVPFQSPSQTVVDLIKQTWPVTMRIGALTILISYPLGIVLGLLSALHRNSWIDYGVTFGSTLGMVVPNFVVAIWLILLFSVSLGWLPTGGWGSPDHLVLPVIAYSLLPTSLVARYTRVSLLGESGRRPCAHGASEGACRAPGADLARGAQRPDPVRDDHDSRDSEHPDRLDLYRADLPRARSWPLLRHVDPYPGLPDDPGAGAAGRGRLGHHVSLHGFLYTLLDPRIRLL